MQATLSKLASAGDVLPPAVQRRRPDEAAVDRPVDAAVRPARLDQVPRGRRRSTAASGAATSATATPAVREQHPGDPGSARQLGAAAAAAQRSGLFGPGCLSGNQESALSTARLRVARAGFVSLFAGASTRGAGRDSPDDPPEASPPSLPAAFCSPCRSRSSRSPSPCSGSPREEHDLERRGAAHVALLGRRRGHRLEALERVPLGTAVLVDRHRGGEATDSRRRAASSASSSR